MLGGELTMATPLQGFSPLALGARSFLCISASSLALCATPAAAQSSAAAGDRTVAEVVVTGTRTERAGFESPTPVTVLGARWRPRPDQRRGPEDGALHADHGGGRSRHDVVARRGVV